jgi:spore maturation protein CgeB
MRIFDILGCGGFMVSNSRPELESLFTVGKDLVVYRDEKDLVEICQYYLEHEKERYDIAQQGYETVKEKHNYSLRLQKIMERVKINA